jgi:fucose permease
MKAAAATSFAPIASFLPELFATRYRYSGSALVISLASVAGGAVPPLLAGTLQATYGGLAIGVMLATVALTSLVCTYLLPETKGTALRSTRDADDTFIVS